VAPNDLSTFIAIITTTTTTTTHTHTKWVYIQKHQAENFFPFPAHRTLQLLLNFFENFGPSV